MSPTGQTADGWWEIGVRRTVPLDQKAAWKKLRTLLDEDAAVRSVRSETPGSVVRATYQPADWDDPSTLQLRVLPAATGSTLSVHHEHLRDAETREAMRKQWTDILEQMVEETA